MGILEIVLIGVGLAMDAFAVSVCKGLSMRKLDWRKAIIIALYFGVFQAIMPVIGYFLGYTFKDLVTQMDHWIAFILLSIIGLKMIKESFNKNSNKCNDCVNFKTMIVLAIATSIDALAVGITFAFFKTNLWISVGIIGIITFGISLLGVKIGNRFGDKYENKAEFIGGLILVFIGLKILLDHLNII